MKDFTQREDEKFEKEFMLEVSLQDGMNMRSAIEYNKKAIAYLHQRDAHLVEEMVKEMLGRLNHRLNVLKQVGGADRISEIKTLIVDWGLNLQISPIFSPLTPIYQKRSKNMKEKECHICKKLTTNDPKLEFPLCDVCKADGWTSDPTEIIEAIAKDPLLKDKIGVISPLSDL